MANIKKPVVDEKTEVEAVAETASASETVSATEGKEKKIEGITDKTVVKVKGLVPHVYYTCPKTNDTFIWGAVGDIQEMTVEQLKLMKVRHEGYFTKKWLYPMNEEALKMLRIKDIFAIKSTGDNLSALYGNDIGKAEEFISFVQDSDIEAIGKKIKNAVELGKIQNVKIIRLLEKKFDLDLISLI